jgi:hypothetical protein
MGIKVSNNAFGTLAAGINSSATSITLTTGQGARFPTLSAGDYFYATLIDTSNNLEIVKCTARSTDVLTVVRAQENTTARAYSTGDRIEIRITAQTFLDASGIETDEIVAAMISAGAVTEAKIGTGAVTEAKIGTGAVTSSKLASGAAVANIGFTPATQSQAGQTIQGASDFNTMTAIGQVYNTGGDSGTNTPTGGAASYWVTFVSHNVEGVLQLSRPYAGNGTFYVRSSYRDTWYAWRTAF